MEITGNRLMASTIEEVIENPTYQTVKFRIMFPVDFGNNIYEERVITFSDVIYYSVDEIIIPKGRVPQISFIKEVGMVLKTKVHGPKGDKKEITHKRFEIETNSGTRVIEFSQYHFSNQ
jgi:hypothetical protein